MKVIITLIKDYFFHIESYFLSKKYKIEQTKLDSNKKLTVVLIPGFFEPINMFSKLKYHIAKSNLANIVEFRLGLQSIQSLETNTKKLREILKNYNNTILLIGHSKGGLIGYKYLFKYKDENSYLITISTPFNKAIPIFKDFREKHLHKKHLANYYSRFDTVVFPQKALKLNDSIDKKLKDLGHGRILISQELINDIVLIIEKLSNGDIE